MIDVASGDDIPRKGGPGITTADLLVVNKTDLAPYVGADLDTMASDARSSAATCPSPSPASLARRDPPGRRLGQRAPRSLAYRSSRMTRTTSSAPLPGPARERPAPSRGPHPQWCAHRRRAPRRRARKTAVRRAAASEESVPHPSGVHATARIRAEHNGRTTTLPCCTATVPSTCADYGAETDGPGSACSAP